MTYLPKAWALFYGALPEISMVDAPTNVSPGRSLPAVNGSGTGNSRRFEPQIAANPTSFVGARQEHDANPPDLK
jgi:hypothetical protein